MSRVSIMIRAALLVGICVVVSSAASSESLCSFGDSVSQFTGVFDINANFRACGPYSQCLDGSCLFTECATRHKRDVMITPTVSHYSRYGELVIESETIPLWIPVADGKTCLNGKGVCRQGTCIPERLQSDYFGLEPFSIDWYFYGSTVRFYDRPSIPAEAYEVINELSVRHQEIDAVARRQPYREHRDSDYQLEWHSVCWGINGCSEARSCAYKCSCEPIPSFLIDAPFYGDSDPTDSCKRMSAAHSGFREYFTYNHLETLRFQRNSETSYHGVNTDGYDWIDFSILADGTSCHGGDGECFCGNCLPYAEDPVPFCEDGSNEVAEERCDCIGYAPEYAMYAGRKATRSTEDGVSDH